MKTNPVPALLALVLVTAGCTRMKVNVEQTSDYEFDRVRSYQWIDGPQKVLKEADTYIHDDFRNALDVALRERGLQPDLASADIQVAYYVKLREEVEYTTSPGEDERAFSGGFVYNRDDRNWSYAERDPDINVYSVEIGTLTLLVYDTDTTELVWRGNLQTKINRSLPREKRMDRLQAAAQKLIGKLPVTEGR